MENIYYLRKPKRFTLLEAKELLPKISIITADAVKKTVPMFNEIESREKLQQCVPDDITLALQDVVDLWSDEIRKLGAIPKGLWMVDFDFGEGFYGWKWGEEDILYFHPYHQSFEERQPIEEFYEI